MATINIEKLNSSERDALLVKLLSQNNVTSDEDDHLNHDANTLPSGLLDHIEKLVKEFCPEDELDSLLFQAQEIFECHMEEAYWDALSEATSSATADIICRFEPMVAALHSKLREDNPHLNELELNSHVICKNTPEIGTEIEDCVHSDWRDNVDWVSAASDIPEMFVASLLAYATNTLMGGTGLEALNKSAIETEH